MIAILTIPDAFHCTSTRLQYISVIYII